MSISKNKVVTLHYRLREGAEHGPLLVGWAALRELSGKGDEGKTAALGNKALGVKVFPYLSNRLQAEPFCGKSVSDDTSY